MNINLEKNSDLSAVIQVNIQESDYIEIVNKQLSDYRRTASIPGFRPGKVPMGMVKKKYFAAVAHEEINKLVSGELNKYLIENKINLLGEPIPNLEKMGVLDFDNQTEFDYFFDIGLAPEFDIEFVSDMVFPYYEIAVSDEELEHTLEDLKTRFSNEESVESAESTDAIKGTLFALDEQHKRLDETPGISGYLKVGDVSNDENKQKYIGAKKGDVIKTNLLNDLEDEFKVKTLLGLHGSEDTVPSSEFELEVEDIFRPVNAELDETLFKNVFPTMDIATVEEFKEKIDEELKKQSGKQSDDFFLDSVMTSLVDKCAIQLPDNFLKRWLRITNPDTMTEEKIEKEYHSYSNSFKWQLIEEKVKLKYGEEARVSDNDIRDHVANYFKAYSGGDELTPEINAIIDQVLSKENEKERIRRELQGAKLLQAFKNNLKLETTEISREKFNELVAELNKNHNG